MEADLLLDFGSAGDRIHGFVHTRQMLSTEHSHSTCELLHMYMCVCTCGGALCIRETECGGQKSALGALLPTLVFETESLTAPKVTKLTSLLGQQTPETHLSLSLLELQAGNHCLRLFLRCEF